MPAEATHAPDAGPGALVKVSGLGVRFGAVAALSGVDLTVEEGEIVTLIGPNGAGKTTLVRVILGLIAPSAGTLWRRPGLSLGYLPQRISIDPVLPLTVRRFLSLAKAGSTAEIGGALHEVAAGALIDHSIHDLSGGEFQRVLLARALLRAPRLLVLDEPVQGVDLGGQIALYDLIGRLRSRHGVGVLMVSHDLHVVMAATDRVVCLNHHVCCSGAPEAVSRNPAYTELFGAAAARGLAIYSHDHDHEHDLTGAVVHPEEGHGHGPDQEPGHEHDHERHGRGGHDHEADRGGHLGGHPGGRERP